MSLETQFLAHRKRFLSQLAIGFSVLGFVAVLGLKYYYDSWKNQNQTYFFQQLSQYITLLMEQEQYQNQLLTQFLSKEERFKIYLSQTPQKRDKQTIQSLEDQNRLIEKLVPGVRIELLDEQGNLVFSSRLSSREQEDLPSIISIYPIFSDNGHLLGRVKLMRPLVRLATKLNLQMKVNTVILLDKHSLDEQMISSKTPLINGRIAIAPASSNDFLAFLQKSEVRVDQILQSQMTSEWGVWDIWVYTIKLINSKQSIEGYWVVARPEITLWSLLRKKGWVLGVALLVMALVVWVSALIYLKKKQIFMRDFYQSILDSEAEMVVVLNQQELIYENKMFKQIFHADAGHTVQNGSGIWCQFIEEKGYMPTFKHYDQFVAYIMQNKNQLHYIKVKLNEKNHIFQTAISRVENPIFGKYLVLILTDVTELEEAKKQLRELTIRDPLTNLYNRRYFNQRLQEELLRVRRYGMALSLIMFDIDHFKSINDQFGHDVGDEAIKGVTQAVHPFIRKLDALCRVGGEEFVIILPEIEIKNAVKLAERIRQQVSKLKIVGLPRSITISLGVVQANEKDSCDSVYKRLDEAMYEAKQSGRNQVKIGK